MGIFKRKYGIIKTALAAFGKALGNRSAQNTKEFWSARSDALRNDRSWARVIAEYLADRCSAEDREFIAWVFFRARGAAACCGRFYICERTYYTRRETVLSDILCLATGYGLIDLGANTAATEAAARIAAVSDAKWSEVERAVKSRTKRNTPSDRAAVKGMLFVMLGGCTWREMPEEHGDWNAVYKRYSRWRKNGLWSEILRILELEPAPLGI